MLLFTLLAVACIASAQNASYPAINGYRPFQYGYSIGAYPQDYSVIGPPLEAVHESQSPPTGLAVDNSNNLYLTYPRNTGQTPSNVVIATGFSSEEPWPSADIQNCTAGQNASTCFINVQNVVLDSIGQLWVVDSGIPYYGAGGNAVPGGAKIMSFNQTTRALIKTYVIPESLYYDGMNSNDLRINNTLGPSGFAFITDETATGSVLAIDLSNGATIRRLYNTTYTRPDTKYVGVYNGEPVYFWNGTKKSYNNIGADGIALQSGNFYWSVLGSRRFYYLPQSVMANFNLSDADVENAVVFPSECGSEQAGLTADDRGRLYITASEHNAIFYVDTLQSEVNETVNGVSAGGGSGLVNPDNYVLKTLVRNALIQHADSAAISGDGYMYFCTNQLMLRPASQYMNKDNRKGPFRSYRVFIGRGPAV